MIVTNAVFIIYWIIGFAGTLRNLWRKLIEKVRSLKKKGTIGSDQLEVEVEVNDDEIIQP